MSINILLLRLVRWARAVQAEHNLKRHPKYLFNVGFVSLIYFPLKASF